MWPCRRLCPSSSMASFPRLLLLLLLSSSLSSSSCSSMSTLLELVSSRLDTWLKTQVSVAKPVDSLRSASAQATFLSLELEERVCQLQDVLHELQQELQRQQHFAPLPLLRPCTIPCRTVDQSSSESCDEVLVATKTFLENNFNLTSIKSGHVLRRLRLLFSHDTSSTESCELLAIPSRNPLLHNEPRHRPVSLVVVLLDPRTISDRSSTNYKLSRNVITYLMEALVESIDQVALAIMAEDIITPLTEECKQHDAIVPFTSSVKQSVEKILMSNTFAASNLTDPITYFERVLHFLTKTLSSVAARREVHVALVGDARVALQMQQYFSSKTVLTSLEKMSALHLLNVQGEGKRERRSSDVLLGALEFSVNVYNVTLEASLRTQIGDFLQHKPRARGLFDDTLKVRGPFYDPSEDDMQVTLLADRVMHNGLLLAFDIDFRSLIDHLVYFPETVMLLKRDEDRDDSQLISIFHSWAYRPKGSLAQLYPSQLQFPDGLYDEDKLIQQKQGLEKDEGNELGWNRLEKCISNWVIVVLIDDIQERRVEHEDRSQAYTEDMKDTSPIPPFHLHPLKTGNTCRLFNTISTTEAPSVSFFKPAFNSRLPQDYRLSMEDKEKLEAYLSDTTSLLAAPSGLKTTIKSEFQFLVKLFHQLLATSKLKYESYFLRMTLTSFSGLHLQWPASSSENLEDILPSSQKWYVKAKELKGKTVISTPRLDANGGGYMVSISQWISPSFVYRVDIALGFLQSIFNGCIESSGLKWFITDDEGFLVTHQSMFMPGYEGRIQLLHLNHKEPLVGFDLKHQEDLVTVNFCHDYRAESIRRRYNFNLSTTRPTLQYTHMLSNVALGKECYKYKFLHLRSTNVFIGLINATCPSSSVFCPANVNSKQCILCDQQIENERQSCECPCQCPWPSMKQQCGEQQANPLKPCHPLAYDDEDYSEGDEDFHLLYGHRTLNAELTSRLESLSPCLNHTVCSQLKDRDRCLLTAGCAWCEVEELESTLIIARLKEPFCSTNDLCFRGTTRRRAPTGSMSLQDSHDPTTQTHVNRSALGIVLVATLLFFLLMAISVLCFRYKTDVVNRIRVNRNNCNIDDRTVATGNPSQRDQTFEINREQGIENLLLTSVDAVDAIDSLSPYHVNPDYERPANQSSHYSGRHGMASTDSDNGYSTMTVQDSEITPYTQSSVAVRRLQRTVARSIGHRQSFAHNCPGKEKESANQEQCTETSEHVDENDQCPSNQIVVAATVHAW